MSSFLPGQVATAARSRGGGARLPGDLPGIGQYDARPGVAGPPGRRQVPPTRLPSAPVIGIM